MKYLKLSKIVVPRRNKFINDNNNNNKKLRNISDAIALLSILYYRLKYCDIAKSKLEIVSDINYISPYKFSKQSFDRKDNNIYLNFYKLLLIKIVEFFNSSIKSPNDDTFYRKK